MAELIPACRARTALIAVVNPATTLFTDTHVQAKVTYTYQVTAVAGNFGFRETPPSNSASATPR